MAPLAKMYIAYSFGSLYLFTVTTSDATTLLSRQNTGVTYPDPQPCSGSCKGVQDPNVIRRESDGTYFRFGTRDHIQIATAPALGGPWSNSSHPALLHGSTDLQVIDIQNYWAPSVNKIGNLYYMFYTVEDNNVPLPGPKELGYRADLAVATSPSLEGGTWTDHGSLGVDRGNGLYSRIGSAVLVDGSDLYMAFGSYRGGLYGIGLSNPPLTNSSENPPKELVKDDNVPGPKHHASEGAFLFKRNQYYYFFYADGNCCPTYLLVPNAEYKIKMCRATASSGPYYSLNGSNCDEGYGGTILLESHGDNVYSPGGVGVFNDPTEGVVMTYQYLDPPKSGYGTQNLQFGWSHLGFDSEDWPFVAAAANQTSPNANPSSASGSAHASLFGLASMWAVYFGLSFM